MMSKISVIVPIYNVEKYLSRCVDSILAQTFTEFELLLIDDGSPDGCPAICDEYAEKDSRVKVIHKKNEGPSAARNVGIDWVFSNSESEWIAFIDSDDWVHEEYLSMLYLSCKSTGTMISGCSFVRTHGELPDVSLDRTSILEMQVEDYWVGNQINATVAWGKLYSKALWKDVRFPVGKIHEDELVLYRLLFANSRIAYTPNELYYYYYNETGIMAEEWTPKRLLQYKAAYEQFLFFREHDYEKAALESLMRYFYYLCENLKFAKKSGKINRPLAVQLKREIKSSLKLYKGYLTEHNANIGWIYREISPVLFRIKLLFSGAIKKLLRKK